MYPPNCSPTPPPPDEPPTVEGNALKEAATKKPYNPFEDEDGSQDETVAGDGPAAESAIVSSRKASFCQQDNCDK